MIVGAFNAEAPASNDCRGFSFQCVDSNFLYLPELVGEV